jgi:uncharacterized C2H2 Zn-finger protein
MVAYTTHTHTHGLVHIPHTCISHRFLVGVEDDASVDGKCTRVGGYDTTLSNMRVDCVECGRVFTNRGGYVNHIKTHGLVERHIQKGKKTRKSRTVQFKLNCVKYCQLALAVPFCTDCEIWIQPTDRKSVAACTLCKRTVNPRCRSQTEVASELGVSKQQLSKWLELESGLSLIAAERPGMKKMHMGRAVKYSDQSNELYRYVPKPAAL